MMERASQKLGQRPVTPSPRGTENTGHKAPEGLYVARHLGVQEEQSRVCVCVGGVWHKASVSDCLHLAAPIGLSPLLFLTLCGPERVLVVSTEPPDDLSCLTTPGSAVPETGCYPCR